MQILRQLNLRRVPNITSPVPFPSSFPQYIEFANEADDPDYDGDTDFDGVLGRFQFIRPSCMFLN